MKKILIIEDDASYSNLLNDRLSEQGYKVITAMNGEDGLTKAVGEKPQLILLDIRLPGMDGLEMLAKLRRGRTGKSLNVILLTNLEPTRSIIEKTFNGMPNSYLIKSDTSFSALMGSINKALA